MIYLNNVIIPVKAAAEDKKEADYDISDFDYDEDPKIKKKNEDKLDSPDEEIETTEEAWEEEEAEEAPTDYDGDSEY